MSKFAYEFPGEVEIFRKEDLRKSNFSVRAEPNLVAPAFMRASARRGLNLHEEGYSGDGLKPQTVEDARKMADGEALSADKWRRIGPWISRHTVDLEAVDEEGEITPGLVAMLLWGGGSSKSSAARAQDYAERLVARLDEGRSFREQPRDKLGQFASTNGSGASAERTPKEMPASTEKVTEETVTLKVDSKETPLSDGTGTQKEWDVSDTSGNHVGTIKKVREREKSYNAGGARYVTNWYSRPRLRIQDPKIDFDRKRIIEGSKQTNSKDQALKDLIRAHNSIVDINAAVGRSYALTEKRAERLVARMDEKRNEVASVYDSFGEVSND